MSTIDKEALVTELNEAVMEANQEDSAALGIVLFGSRARPNWHLRAARDDRDIDLIPVCAQDDKKVGSNFKAILTRKLASYSQKVHIPEIQEKLPIIAIDAVNKAISGRIDPQEFLRLQLICCLMDEHSVVITRDKQQGEWIQQFAARVEYKHVLWNIHNPQNMRGITLNGY